MAPGPGPCTGVRRDAGTCRRAPAVPCASPLRRIAEVLQTRPSSVDVPGAEPIAVIRGDVASIAEGRGKASLLALPQRAPALYGGGRRSAWCGPGVWDGEETTATVMVGECEAGASTSTFCGRARCDYGCHGRVGPGPGRPALRRARAPRRRPSERGRRHGCTTTKRPGESGTAADAAPAYALTMGRSDSDEQAAQAEGLNAALPSLLRL